MIALQCACTVRTYNKLVKHTGSCLQFMTGAIIIIIGDDQAKEGMFCSVSKAQCRLKLSIQLYKSTTTSPNCCWCPPPQSVCQPALTLKTKMYPSVGVLLALWALEVARGQACPRSCNCYQANEVHCTFRSLLTVPAGLPARTRRINLG